MLNLLYDIDDIKRSYIIYIFCVFLVLTCINANIVSHKRLYKMSQCLRCAVFIFLGEGDAEGVRHRPQWGQWGGGPGFDGGRLLLQRRQPQETSDHVRPRRLRRLCRPRRSTRGSRRPQDVRLRRHLLPRRLSGLSE